jgi:cytochrome c oxidase subunit 4
MAELHDAAEIKRHVRIYLTVFGALAVLTIVTVSVGYLHLPIAPALIAALLIASIKAGLVAAYFMHLISERKIIMWMLVLTFVFLLFMFGLFVTAYKDQQGIFDSI